MHIWLPNYQSCQRHCLTHSNGNKINNNSNNNNNVYANNNNNNKNVT